MQIRVLQFVAGERAREVEAARAPAQLVGAVFEISTMPMRSVAGTVAGARRAKPADPPDD